MPSVNNCQGNNALQKSHCRQIEKKKKFFTKVLHHRHISHCWQNETFGDKRRLNTEFKSLLLAGFVLPFRGDTDVEDKGLTSFLHELTES